MKSALSDFCNFCATCTPSPTLMMKGSVCEQCDLFACDTPFCNTQAALHQLAFEPPLVKKCDRCLKEIQGQGHECDYCDFDFCASFYKLQQDLHEKHQLVKATNSRK